jgi:hypothetical protein
MELRAFQMKRLLPGLEEFAILLTLSVLFAAISWTMSKPDLALSVLSIPLFITSAIMGMRRCPRYASVTQTVVVETRGDSGKQAA